MQYTDITEYNATSFTEANRTIADIDTIVIHHWGNDGQRFEDVCNFFAGGPGTSPDDIAVLDAALKELLAS